MLFWGKHLPKYPLTTYLSPQACPGGGEVDLRDHGDSVGGDDRGRIPRGQEETEVFIVVNDFVSHLNDVPRP